MPTDALLSLILSAPVLLSICLLILVCYLRVVRLALVDACIIPLGIELLGLRIVVPTSGRNASPPLEPMWPRMLR